MDRKLRSKAGQAIYALRKTIVEPMFGQIKGARGLDHFRWRGLGTWERDRGADGHHRQPAQAVPGIDGHCLSPVRQAVIGHT